MGLDLPLLIELQQLGHSLAKELLVSNVAQVETGDGLVGLHQFQGVERELVVPGLCHGQQVLLLTCYTVGCTWDYGQQNRFNSEHSAVVIYLLGLLYKR